MSDEIPLVPIFQGVRRRDRNSHAWKQGAVGNWELINAFFGFDSEPTRDPWPPPAELRNQFVANYIRSKPDINQACPRMFPVAVCVALRKLIISNRDPGRPLDTKFGSRSLSGLRLERNSRLEIHRGFGFLWHFCETAKNQIQPQIKWFIVRAHTWHNFPFRAKAMAQVRRVTLSQCRDMLQIWESLRMLIEASWLRRLYRKAFLECKLLRQGRLQPHLQTQHQLHRKLHRQKSRKFRGGHGYVFYISRLKSFHAGMQWSD